MVLTDYKCKECGHIFTITKKNMENWSDILVTMCNKCGSTNTFRIIKIGAVDVAEGSVGNSKNGYMKSLAGYKPSRLGKYKGTKVTN